MDKRVEQVRILQEVFENVMGERGYSVKYTTSQLHTIDDIDEYIFDFGDSLFSIDESTKTVTFDLKESRREQSGFVESCFGLALEKFLLENKLGIHPELFDGKMQSLADEYNHFEYEFLRHTLNGIMFEISSCVKGNLLSFEQGFNYDELVVCSFNKEIGTLNLRDTYATIFKNLKAMVSTLDDIFDIDYIVGRFDDSRVFLTAKYNVLVLPESGGE